MSSTKAADRLARGTIADDAMPSALAGELASAPDSADATVEFETLVRRQLELLGEDPERDGLLKTPSRVAKSLAWLTRGYEQDAREVIGDALFAESHENMVLSLIHI